MIKNKDFGNNITNSKKNVAVVMSQRWCSQWTMVKNWLKIIPDDLNLDIYLIVYDNTEYYEDFMSFKENVFGNYEIPYIRYYIDGVLVKESNFTSLDFFLKTFKLK